MKQWWEQNKVIPDSYTPSEAEDFKSKVEDLTGSILLLLDRCVVNGKINLSVDALETVFSQVQNFMNNCKDSLTERGWQRWGCTPSTSLRTLLTCVGIVTM